MDADEKEHILEEIFADSGSDMSLDESSPPTSEDSDEEHIPTSSSSSEKQNFLSGWRTASAPDYKRKRPPMQFTEHTGCTQDCSKFSPVQILQLYICQAVWELMVEETNRYAAQTLSADIASQPSTWTPTNVPEMMAFVTLLLSMGINKRPRYSMHWSTSDVLRSALYSSTMSRNRFTAILRFLHLANNQAQDKFPPDKLFKVRPLLDIVLPSFLL